MLIIGSSELIDHFPKAFLRPHHIESIRQYKSKGAEQRKKDFEDNSRVYGVRFATKGLMIFEYVRDATVVEVVSGPDDICRAGCRFYRGCAVGDYSNLVAAMLNSIRPDSYEADVVMIKRANPEKSDISALEKLAIDIGGQYRFGDIRPR